MESRSCLVVASAVTQATGKAERDAAVQMARSLKGSHHKTLGADKGYDTRVFVLSRLSSLKRESASAKE